MSDNRRASIRIELTKEQQDQIKAAWGREAAAVELNVEHLEERVAPLSLQYGAVEWTYSKQNS